MRRPVRGPGRSPAAPHRRLLPRPPGSSRRTSPTEEDDDVRTPDRTGAAAATPVACDAEAQSLHVEILATDLTPIMQHAQRNHGIVLPDGTVADPTPPTVAADDADGDGHVDLAGRAARRLSFAPA